MALIIKYFLYPPIVVPLTCMCSPVSSARIALWTLTVSWLLWVRGPTRPRYDHSGTSTLTSHTCRRPEYRCVMLITSFCWVWSKIVQFLISTMLFFYFILDYDRLMGNALGSVLLKQYSCTNKFYTLVPHDFGMTKPPPLNSEEVIKIKTQMLDNLLEIEVAYSLLKQEDGVSGGKDLWVHSFWLYWLNLVLYLFYVTESA